MVRSSWIRLMALLLGPAICGLADQAQARGFRVPQLPNGTVNGCANCHVYSGGGGTRNVFGQMIESRFLSTAGSAGNVLWGPTLAQLDADNDGATNGQELGDPAGTWKIGDPAPGVRSAVTKPWDPTSKPTTSQPPANTAPAVANAITAQSLTVGGLPFTRRLNGTPAVFRDAEGDTLTYAATSANARVATATVSGVTLSVMPVAVGSTTVTVTATDSHGASGATTFTVTVTAPTGPATTPPVVVNAVPSQKLNVGGTAFTRWLNAMPVVFRPSGRDTLTYTATSSNSRVASVAIASKSKLTVTPVAAGTARITVTASDGHGGTASTTFTVTVTAPTRPNTPPVVATRIPAQRLTMGGTAFTRRLNGMPVVFRDANGDTLTYTATSSNARVATATVSGATLTVTPVAAGTATITVTASDGHGGTIAATFSVTVAAASGLIGDFNDDGIVNFDDFFLWADHYNATAGSPTYSERFDLSANGRVDLEDFSRLADHLGEGTRR